MARLETWLKQDLKRPLKVQYLGGNLFSQDNQANLIGVEVFDEGVAATLGGSVSASVIRADGGTVAVPSGTVSGNKATVVLPQAAYAVPGQVSIVLKLTQSGVVTTLAALVAIVYKSSTDTVIDPGTILPSVETLIAQINTAVASIPADYSNLWATIAPVFDDNTAYAAGRYVTYNGHLYKYTADHAAGSFVTTDCTQVDVASELLLKADKTDTVLATTLSRGRRAGSTVGVGSIAFGNDNTASNSYSVALGDQSVAIGANSYAHGKAVMSGSTMHYTTASGDTSHAEGSGTLASGTSSHAEGSLSTASGNYAHAEGLRTTASGANSHVEGDSTSASAYASHAEGGETTASGFCAHAEGAGSIASGYASHAEGVYTIANHKSQHTFGEFNIEDASATETNERGTYIEIIGNGTGNSARSNARTLDWNGNEELAGDLKINAGGNNELSVTELAGDVSSVKSALNDLEDLKSKETTGYLTPFVQGSVSQVSGVIDQTDTENCYIGKIPMFAGDSVTFSRSVNKITLNPDVVVYDTNGDFVSGRTFTGTYTFEADGFFAIDAHLNATVSATMEEAIAAANTSFIATLTTKSKIVKTINEQGDRLDSIELRKLDTPDESGTEGQVLGLDSNLTPVWVDQSGGGASIDDNAGIGDTDKTWSANKLAGKFNAIENLENEIITGYLTPFVQGSVDQNTGAIDTTSTSNCYIGKLPMKSGDSFTYSRAANTITTTCSLIIYNESGTYVSGRGVGTGTTITFENDGMFAICCTLNSNVSATMEQAISSANSSFNATLTETKKIVNVVNKNTEDIKKINTDIEKMNGVKLTESNLSTGVYYKVTDGVVSQQIESGAKYYPIIDVSAFVGMKMRVWMNTRRAGSSRSFGFCDSQGNVGNYYQETACGQVADGGYYRVLVVDKDYMFFSCSSDPTKIRIEISGETSFVDNAELSRTLQNGKYYHMSFDDVILCLQDITTNAEVYASVFENGFLGWCKKMHEIYGTTFSMYVFYANDKDNPTWTLEDCTNAFADEFTANSDWLKFGLHAYAQGVNATGRESTAGTDYANAIDQLVRITGDVKCIDRVPRLHEYNGTLAALTAMRDCNLGPVGFIASADTDLTTPRDSYYFDADQNAYMYKHCYMYDADNMLHFVKTSYLWGSSSVSVPTKENSVLYFNRNRYVEVFTHENQLTSGTKESFDAKFNALSYSHRPYFMMNLVLTN